jgi:Skp family chaperone for outer membrane proteins
LIAGPRLRAAANFDSNSGMKLSALPVFAALALSVAACQRPAAPHGTVAILDLDAVAKRLGRDVAITDQIKAENDTLVAELTKTKDTLQSQLDSSAQSLGDKPTDEQKQKLIELGQSLNSQLQVKRQEARQELSQKQTALIQQFREEVKPVAQKIAAGKGMNTVLLRSDLVVLSADPAVDITDAVVAEMAGSAKTSPAPSASPAK